MKTRTLIQCAVFTSLFGALGCSKTGDQGTGGSGAAGKGNISVRVLSSAVAPAGGRIRRPAANFLAATNCTVATTTTSESGKCLTPLKVIAKGGQIDVYNSFGGSGARVIQLNAGPSGQGYAGPYGALGATSFDFSTPATVTNEYSDDNFQDAPSGSRFNRASMGILGLDVQIEVSADAGTPYWTIRTPFVHYDLMTMTTKTGQTIDACLTETGTRNAVAAGHVYAAPAGYRRGDILLCRKATSDAACEDAEFKWIDSTAGTESTTRPSNPVALTGTYLYSETACTPDGEGAGRASFNFGQVRLAADLTSGFTMSRTYVSASEGTQASGYDQYVYTGNCSVTSTTGGTCTGTSLSGKKPLVSIDFDLTNAVFARDSVNLESDDVADIKMNLQDVLLKPIWVEKTKTAEGTGNSPLINATFEASFPQE